ncbi:MAG TPA: M15 family metallopeptidase [Perlabentimonas sp.]|nr:M15 family metallopeptidase [Tenuifilaceae bacterium]HZJ73330.1 M15 family metallopeptidase [Perlabentimonas sp.]
MKSLIKEHVFLLAVFSILLVTCVNAGDSNPPNGVDNPIQHERQNQPKPQPIDTAYYTRLLLGKVQYRNDTSFVLVSPKHSSKQIYLEKSTYKAFRLMYGAAKADGVHLLIISGARNFDYQKRIWERKWNARPNSCSKIEKAKGTLMFSAMPSTSRHHWGTDFDLNSLENSYFDSGRGLAEYKWLCQNAHRFGFCQVYTNKQQTGRTGYEMEKWHWSYMPLASQYLRLYAQLISNNDISGFPGCELAHELNVINDYVFGVSNCQGVKLSVE